MDTQGNTIKNIQADKYETSLAGLSEEQREYALDQIPLDLYAEIAGMDHLYFYSFLSTGNMLKTVEGLYELIQIAKKETGHDKVNLVPIRAAPLKTLLCSITSTTILILPLM